MNFENQQSGTILRYLLYFILGIIISCYYFPFEFTFLPKGINTKIMLAVLGIIYLGMDTIKAGEFKVNKALLPAVLIAVVFSILGFISVDINNSQDYSYANYMVSFTTWMTAAYATCALLRWIHGYASFELLFNYLIAICVVQCCLALAIDNYLPLKLIVDRYISQDTVADVEFLNRVNRLYGIGAAIDVAGTRFSIVLIALVAILLRERTLKVKSSGFIICYWGAFVIIAVVGNMISRTTTIGLGLGLAYLLYYSKLIKSEVSYSTIKLWRTIFLVSFCLIIIAVYFYQTNEDVREQLRFGFEGFFNWIETGTWTTSSTERLNSVMWIWPETNDFKTWLIGKATFDVWRNVGTDIGYCRFVFYNGLLGLVTFSLFFVYNAWAMYKKFPAYGLFFILLLALSFIIWLKVATDLFIIYALFYCLDSQKKLES